MARKQKYRVRVYFDLDGLKAVALDAERSGLRRGGLPVLTQKAHGFAGQMEANTVGISKLLKKCLKYWREAEPKRLQEAAEQLRIKQEAEAKLKALGHLEK